MWKFDQSAGLHFETRATGILSTHAILPGETSPYGVCVADGVFAPNHQHIFSLRIDPAIGGLGEGNSVVQEDSVPMKFDRANPPANNRYGVGYTVEKTLFKKSGYADAAPEKNRIFKVCPFAAAVAKAETVRSSTRRALTRSRGGRSGTSWFRCRRSSCSLILTLSPMHGPSCESSRLFEGAMLIIQCRTPSCESTASRGMLTD